MKSPIHLFPTVLLLLFASSWVFSQSPSSSPPTTSPKPATSPSSGRSSKDTTSLSSLESVTIRLADPDALSATRPENLFRHFEVIDERPDTARIGIHSGFKIFRSRNRQLAFARPAGEEVAAFLNRHFARPDAPYTALIVLRILWLSDANYVREDLMQDPDKSTEKTHIRIKAEIYAVKEDGYRPILRFDSSQVSKRIAYSLWGNDLAGMLDDLADSASLLTARKAPNSRSLRLEEIRQFNQSRFSAPVSTDTALTRGVYASFEEFKANDPSIRDFEIKKEKDKRLLYVKEAGGGAYYSHNVWGYCDGKDIFIMKDGILRPVWREGKAYYFFSEAADKERAFGSTYPGVPPTSTGPILNPGATTATDLLIGGAIAPLIRRSPNTNIRIFTVDMDSGEIY
jgi:hypothetical protein